MKTLELGLAHLLEGHNSTCSSETRALPHGVDSEIMGLKELQPSLSRLRENEAPGQT
jgi:hypothetical protein